jgi:phosphoesterase RecJ-like protein
MWEDVAKSLSNSESYVITTHVNPEGDAIGSEVALAAFLRDLGKRVTIVNSSPTPVNCAFMDPTDSIKVYPDDCDPSILKETDIVVIVDVNNWDHLGGFADALRESPVPRVCIDHHQGGDEDFADIVVTDTSAAATGVIVYELIRYMGGEITPQIATACYAAIITDTGSFRYSNTDERVFQIATDLTRMGVDPFLIHRKIFSRTPEAVKLLGSVLNTLENTPDGKLAWIHATGAMFDKSGAAYEDSDGILEIVRSTQGVEFCAFFKELPDGRIKVSLRSNGKVDVYEIARSHGGGGHRMAAGMALDGPMDRAIQLLINDCAENYIPRS